MMQISSMLDTYAKRRLSQPQARLALQEETKPYVQERPE
jgi:hypothetical protein